MMEKHKDRSTNEAENVTTKQSIEVLSAESLYVYDQFSGEELLLYPGGLYDRSVLVPRQYIKE